MLTHLLLTFASCCLAAADHHDLVVYGGTPAGIMAAVEAKQLGISVVLIEPSGHLGGMTTAGLGRTDAGRQWAIGGLARKFYHRIFLHYQRPEAWIHETPSDYKKISPRLVAADTQWGFEPRVATAVFRDFLSENHVPVMLGQRLDLNGGVRKQGTRITAIVMESGRVFAGKMFIDASYEGDLMAKAGVSYTIGRESNAQYGETFNGVQTRWVDQHQFLESVDPYVVPGDPTSGLLPRIATGPPDAEGEGDRCVQAYCYRLCTTDVAENRCPWPKPKHYDERQYELLLRSLEAGDLRVPFPQGFMPNRKTDINNGGPFSTDNIGRNYDYPDADYATRDRIVQEHLDYTQGLMWTLANHPRVPEKVRKEFQTWSLAKDEFVDNDHWPPQLYIREARRMVSDYVITENDCFGKTIAKDSVGMVTYSGMDSHQTQRYVDANGHVRNEGGIWKGIRLYPISYRAIVPKASQCTNLLVPVCVSASHIAYGSVRMEPTYMILGQSSAAAAALALESNCDVQAIDYRKLRKRLLAEGQILAIPKRKH
ncbi:MAG: FAD-dependent oxidoreductase [Pirellulales bacterium]|nr:FAD-dependent oxidoreductase [Pirellulales bacterium]